MQRIPLAGGGWTPILGIERTSFLAFGPNDEMWWASMVGFGTRRRDANGRDSLVFPRSTINQVLPDGRHAIGVAVTTAANTGSVQYLDLQTGDARSVFDTPVMEVRFAMGYLFYVTADGRLMAAPFDVKRGTVTGVHVEMAAGVSIGAAGIAQFAVSDNGTVAYIPGSSSDLVRVTGAGNARVIGDVPRRYHSPRVSPDGKRIAFDDVSTTEGRDVFVLTEGMSTPTRATFARDGHDAVWMPDGRGLYYTSGSGGTPGVFSVRFNSTEPARAESIAVELSYTGTPLAAGGFITSAPGAGRGLDIVRVRSHSAKVDTVLASPADESFVVPTPDGKWFAYVSDHSGRPEVYVRALAGSNAQLQVSLDGGGEPVWARNGRQLFYRRDTPKGAELVAATIEFGAEPRVVKRVSLFDVSNFDSSSPHANYDVSPDGNWFVFSRRNGADFVAVIQNAPELARRLSRGGTTP
jgi:dipeptidyl aminopeptidase/acylaminoacyl peptidase